MHRPALRCTNGATTEVFLGVDGPLVLPILNINYPQTRKSSAFGTGNTVGHTIDAFVLDIAQRRGADALAADSLASQTTWPSAQPGQIGPSPVAGMSRLTVTIHSSPLTSFTEAAFIQ